MLFNLHSDLEIGREQYVCEHTCRSAKKMPVMLLVEEMFVFYRIEGSPGPEPIYIKQAQATLQHMKEIEVLSLAGKW